MTVQLTTHGCGKSWRQRGNRTGHCARCHNTFEGERLFDAHFVRVGNGVECREPASMLFNKRPLVFDGTYGDGAWSRTDLTDSAFEGRESSGRVDGAGGTGQAVEAENRDVSEAVLS